MSYELKKPSAIYEHAVDSDEYVQPTLHESTGSRRNQRKLNQKYMNHLEGKWTQEEDLIYFKFITENQQKLVSKATRRSSKVFKQLAESLIFTRTPEQCRMYHQRMKKKSRGRSIQSIIKFFSKKYDKNAFINKEKLKLNEKGFSEKKIQQINQKKEERTRNPDAREVEIKYGSEAKFVINIKILLKNIQDW